MYASRSAPFAARVNWSEPSSFLPHPLEGDVSLIHTVETSSSYRIVSMLTRARSWDKDRSTDRPPVRRKCGVNGNWPTLPSLERAGLLIDTEINPVERGRGRGRGCHACATEDFDLCQSERVFVPKRERGPRLTVAPSPSSSTPPPPTSPAYFHAVPSRLNIDLRESLPFSLSLSDPPPPRHRATLRGPKGR